MCKAHIWDSTFDDISDDPGSPPPFRAMDVQRFEPTKIVAAHPPFSFDIRERQPETQEAIDSNKKIIYK